MGGKVMTVHALPFLGLSIYLFYSSILPLYLIHHEPQLATGAIWWVSTATHWSIRWSTDWRIHGTTTDWIHGSTAAATAATAHAIDANRIRRSAAATTASDAV